MSIRSDWTPSNPPDPGIPKVGPSSLPLSLNPCICMSHPLCMHQNDHSQASKNMHNKLKKQVVLVHHISSARHPSDLRAVSNGCRKHLIQQSHSFVFSSKGGLDFFCPTSIRPFLNLSSGNTREAEHHQFTYLIFYQHMSICHLEI